MAKSSKNMTTALWHVKSSSRSYCVEFAHSWPHLLLGYPVERHGRLGPPGQKGFPSRDTLSRQWEMLPVSTPLSCVRSVTGLKGIYGDLLALFFYFSFSRVCSGGLLAPWRLLLSLQTSFHLTGKHQFVFLWQQMFPTQCNSTGGHVRPTVKIAPRDKMGSIHAAVFFCWGRDGVRRAE